MKKIGLCILFLSIINFSCKNEDKNIENSNFKELWTKTNSLYSSNSYYEAKIYLDSILKIDSLNINYLFLRANCKTFINDYDGSKSDYIKVLKLIKKLNEKTYINLGLVYEMNDEIEQAMHLYHLADSMNPIFGLGKIHIERLIKEQNMKKSY